MAILPDHSQTEICPPALTCQSCHHFAPGQRDPHNLAAPVVGECRESLHVVVLPAGPAQLAIKSIFPPTNERQVACGRHKAKVIV